VRSPPQGVQLELPWFGAHDPGVVPSLPDFSARPEPIRLPCVRTARTSSTLTLRTGHRNPALQPSSGRQMYRRPTRNPPRESSSSGVPWSALIDVLTFAIIVSAYLI